MSKKNIFVVGSEATGSSFFGRNQELSSLEKELVDSANKGISLVGPTRIGKSSLIGVLSQRVSTRPGILWISLSMGELDNPSEFWYSVVKEIEDKLKEKDLLSPELAEMLEQLEAVFVAPTWYIQMNRKLKQLLSKLREKQIQLVLIIDEFDQAPGVFQNQTSHFQLLRTIYSGGEYNVKGILASRRRLPMIESNSDGISTFHGVFQERTLREFKEDELCEIWDALSDYDIFLQDNTPVLARLFHYTNNMPYLMSMFMHKLVELSDSSRDITPEYIDELFQILLLQVRTYYDDLIQRLRGDSVLEEVAKLCLLQGSYLKDLENNGAQIEKLKVLGILHEGVKENLPYYYTYSHDFTVYLKLQTLDIPVWDSLYQSELRLKEVFLQIYPELSDFSYEDLRKDQKRVDQSLNQLYPELKINLGTMKRYAEDLNMHKPNPSLIDVLTLTYIIKIIKNEWKKFQDYFPGDENQWQKHLQCIADTRNPICHANGHHVNSTKLVEFKFSCQEVLDKSKTSLNS